MMNPFTYHVNEHTTLKELKFLQSYCMTLSLLCRHSNDST